MIDCLGAKDIELPQLELEAVLLARIQALL
jgi:hypothetical protein